MLIRCRRKLASAREALEDRVADDRVSPRILACEGGATRGWAMGCEVGQGSAGWSRMR